MAYARLSGTPRYRRMHAAPRGGGRGDRLGNPLVVAQAAVAAAQTAKSLLSSVSHLFGGGASVDAMRQRRADFFGQAADVGSITAARYLIGGTLNTASHEIPDYQRWIDRLLAESPDQPGYQAMVTARVAGQKWAAGIPDPAGTQSMINDVNQDLVTIGQAAEAVPVGWGTSSSSPIPTGTGFPPAGGGATGRPQQLPTMQSTAPYNYAPWLIGGAIGLGVLLMRKH